MSLISGIKAFLEGWEEINERDLPKWVNHLIKYGYKSGLKNGRYNYVNGRHFKYKIFYEEEQGHYISNCKVWRKKR